MPLYRCGLGRPFLLEQRRPAALLPAAGVRLTGPIVPCDLAPEWQIVGDDVLPRCRRRRQKLIARAVNGTPRFRTSRQARGTDQRQ